jgi:CHASE2 domain-containing sensor protein
VEPEGPLRLNFSGERYTFEPLSAENVLQASKTEGWRTNGPLKGKVVLLGGYYRASRDFYVTPVGRMAGVQLMAQAVESELHGGIRTANHLAAFALDVLAGLIVVLIQHRFRLLPALVISLVAIPCLSFIGSFLAFSTLAWWVSFAPVTAGVLVHELYHHAAEYQRLRQEHRTASGRTSPPSEAQNGAL